MYFRLQISDSRFQISDSRFQIADCRFQIPDQFAAKQDQLDARVTALTREVRNGFDDYNRKINALDQRLLSFETWLSRIDDRLHEEIMLARVNPYSDRLPSLPRPPVQ